MESHLGEDPQDKRRHSRLIDHEGKRLPSRSGLSTLGFFDSWSLSGVGNLKRSGRRQDALPASTKVGFSQAHGHRPVFEGAGK